MEGANSQGASLWAAGKRKAGSSPVKFRIMGFEPVCAKNDVVSAYGSNVKFGSFFVVMIVRGLDVKSLDCSMSDRDSFVQGAVNIFDG